MTHFLVLSVLPSIVRLLEEASRNLSAEIQMAALEGRFHSTVLETIDLPISLLPWRRIQATSRWRARRMSDGLEPVQRARGDAHRFTLHRRRLG